MAERSYAVIAGARPNFMKVAPILRAFDNVGAKTTLIHTGQHYDANLSDIFFQELNIRPPDIALTCEGVTQATQTASILVQLEKVFTEGLRFTDVVVVGDVNSTVAAALAAKKCCLRLSHVEAGLRSGDRSMPEEVNRLMTDAVSDLLFASEPEAVSNLRREGHPPDRVYLVGNVMIDTLHEQLPRAAQSDVLKRFNLRPAEYGLVTFHRPGNVDHPEKLRALSEVLLETSRRLPLVFPVHPRTRRRLGDFGIIARLESADDVRMVDPVGYVDMLALNMNAKVLITDSGGLQEEATALGTPCLTMRDTTERPITVTEGTSTLVGDSAQVLRDLLQQVILGEYKEGRCPELWDGNAAKRIVGKLAEYE